MQRLAGTIMWDRASPAATAVAKPLVEAWPPEIAKDKSLDGKQFFAVSPGGAGSPGSRASGTTSTAEVAAVAESVVEARPLEIATNRATTETTLAVSAGAAGSSWPGKQDTTVDAATAVAKSAGEARRLGIAKQSATTESDIAESSGGAGSSWSRAHGATSRADVTAAAESSGKVRHPGIAKCSARESEIAESSVQAGPPWSRASGSASTAEMAVGGPKISRQENVEVVNERVPEEIRRYLDEKRGSPPQVLEFVQGLRERMQRQLGRAPPFEFREEMLNC